MVGENGALGKGAILHQRSGQASGGWTGVSLNGADATMRLFFAFWPDAEAAQQLACLAREQALRWGGKASRRDSLHLTLAFLGELPQEALPQLMACAHRLVWTAFDLRLDCLNGWPGQRLLWAGCRHVPPALGDLAARLRRGLGDAGLAPAEAAPDFVPHLTLVRRLRENPPPQRLLPEQVASWRCSRFCLVESVPHAAGRHYRVLSAFPAQIHSPARV